jgi:hypothetical protein
MKTALCFAGTGRSIERTFDNLYNCLINDLTNTVNGCDIFVYITDTPIAATTEKYFSEHATNIEVVKEEDTNPKIWQWHDQWPPSIPNNLWKGRDIYLKMIRSRKHLMDMIDKSATKYDRIIFSRMDVQYESKFTEMDKGMDMNYLWLPHFHHYIGYNDRFAVGGQDVMRTYMSQWDSMETYRSEGWSFQAESTLKHHLDRHNLTPKIFYCNFIRIRPIPHESFASIQKHTKPCDI